MGDDDYLKKLPVFLSPTNNVRRSCYEVMKDSIEHRTVTIQGDGISKTADKIAKSIINASESSMFVEWDESGWHYTAENYIRPISSENLDKMKIERIALYILTIDTINFCFWPAHMNLNNKEPLEYDHLAIALKRIAEMDDDGISFCPENFPSQNNTSDVVVAEPSYKFSPQNLCSITPSELENLLSPYLSALNTSNIPNIKERCRLLNELGNSLIYHFRSSASYLLKKSCRSADKMVHLLTSFFPGFRDTAILPCFSDNTDNTGNARTVFFYKRAQICVGDFEGALSSKLLRTFNFHDEQDETYFKDLDCLTTFPDYRVPQLLHHFGVLKYTSNLQEIISTKQQISFGDKNEIYIRAATVVAVEELVKEVNEILRNQNGKEGIIVLNSLKMDWYLWQLGEELEKEKKMEPHRK